MIRIFAAAGIAVMVLGTAACAEQASGVYMEARTCQVYTGPCFANGEVGLAGRDAMMAWSIEEGSHEGVDLSGLNVILVVNTTRTIGHQGVAGAGEAKSVVMVDERASDAQREALLAFAKAKSGKAGQNVVRVSQLPIAMSLDTFTLNGKLEAGKQVKLVTRKARPSDCICSNESAYYPPLAELQNFAPGVTIEGEFKGRGLGSNWSIPGSRSAYMATFSY